MILELDFTKKLKDFSLDLSLKVNTKKLGLLGESGSGKTMTLKLIAGLEKADRGRLVFDKKVLFDSGKNINIPARNRKIAYLFQNYALFPHMTVEENLKFAYYKNMDSNKLFAEIVEITEIGKILKSYPSKISGGEKQRVALTRIILSKPSLVLLDEPFSALDVSLREKFEEEVFALLDRYQIPYIIVSHDKGEIFRQTSHIAIIRKGEILDFGSREEIFYKPKTIYQARLMGFQNIVASCDFPENESLKIEGISKYFAIKANHIRLREDPKGEFYIFKIIEDIDKDLIILKKRTDDKIFIKVISDKDRYIENKDYFSLEFEEENLVYLNDQ